MNLESFYKSINDKSRRDYPQVSLHKLIDQQCRQTPDSVAVLDENSKQTFAELNIKSDQLAAHLNSQGLGRGDLVGLCCNRDVDLPALLVGIMKSGAGYVPLDPDYPVDRLKFMVDNSELKHVVAHTDQLNLTSQFNVSTTVVDRDWDKVVSEGNLFQSSTSGITRDADPATDVAYMIYTSGSTGQPKGVLVPHRSAVNMLHSLIEWPGFTNRDRILATTTLSFDISVAEMFLPLITGGSVAVVDRKTARDTAALVAAMEKFAITFMQATPAMWRMIVEADFPGRRDMKFITAGEPLPRDLIQPMLNRCGQVWNLYGPTETTVYSAGTQIHSDQGPILIGVPIANTQVYIVDENDQLCAPDVPGELLIAGDGMTLGYLKRPELNAEKFTQWNGVNVYRTGDLAAMTIDGQINHMGRIDNQIKFNGHRIELGEIDAAIATQPAVRQAATVLREDRPGDKRLVGYLLADENQEPDIASIRESISRSLPDYMVPNVIVVVNEFPYTSSGKLDRNGFAPPSSARPDLGIEFLPPRTVSEKQLAAIWEDVLQIDQVGLQDNFFELGGNSIRAVKVVARLRTEMSLHFSNAEFFDNPTIESLLGFADKKQQLADSIRNWKGKEGRRPIDCLNSRGSQSDQSANARDSKNELSGYAIVGMAARMPGAHDLQQFWSNLVDGVESIKFFSSEELDSTLDARDTGDPNYVAARGIIEDADHFDAKFFRTPPRTAEMTCPQQRIMLELAWTALEDAGIIPQKSADTIGIWAGTYSTSYYIKNILTNPELVRQTGEFQAGVLNEKDYIATRIAHAMNLTGPAINVNTACSTSLVALIEACKSLDDGHCDVALAGGASVTFPQNSGHLHQPGSIFSPDGHCRPFDAAGQGTLFSDGAGVVVVKRLVDAITNGDRIYAVVKGFGINNDGGEKASFSAPSISGQAGAVAMAHSMAGVSVDSIGYIEAHGTATPIGDPIEVTALQTVFESQTDRKQFCAIGSVKSNIGHTVAAAGVAGLIKAAMSLHEEKIPATLHYEKPNPQIDFENSPFRVCDSLTPWERNDEPRRAGVSSFGVGGTNAHILLEESPLVQTRFYKEVENALPMTIVPISGKTEKALCDNVRQLAEFCSENAAREEKDRLSIEQIASSLHDGRADFAWRAAIVTDDIDDAAETFVKKQAPRFMKRKSSPSNRDVVFMFPGQGAQYVRMGQNLYEGSAVFKDAFDTCSELMLPLLDRDLRTVLFPSAGDEESAKEILQNTQFTQPALFSLGYSLAKVWMAWGIKPSALMGHSIGEFAAACTSGVFSLEDGLKIIAQRGAEMQSLPGGSMMSVRLPGEEVEPMLSGDLAIGSYNGPQLCVVAGPDDQVAQLQQMLEAKDVVCRHLHTSHAFHSPMMNSVVAPFAEFISQFELCPPRIPILSTVTGKWMTDGEATDPRYWAEHLRKPVQFSAAVTEIWDEKNGDPSRILVELGPRRTLSTLSKQHATDPKNQIAIPTLTDNTDDNAEWRSTLAAVAQLWLAGVSIDWKKLSSDGNPKRKLQHVTLPTYAFQRQQYFIEPATSHVEKQSVQTIPSMEQTPMSRIPNIVSAIKEVFENTSGFDLDEFDGGTTFFEMGLDSLVLTQTATALKKEMDFDITFRQLLEETPSVDSLSVWLDEKLPPQQYAAPAAAIPEPPTGTACETDRERPIDTETPIAVSPIPAVRPACETAAPQPQLSNPVAGSAAESIIQSQLQLMASQLQILSGQPAAVLAQPVRQAIADTPVATNTTVAGSSQTTASETLTSNGNDAASDAEDSRDKESNSHIHDKAKRFSTVKVTDSALDATQQIALDKIIRMHNLMTPKSKAYAQRHRKYMADPRTVSGFRPNMKEMTHPIVIERSKGAQLWDIDGNEYTDFTSGFGSNLLGHCHDITIKAITEQVQKDYAIGPQSPLAGEVAKLFCELTGNERMAFSNTGSEAVLGCTRLARNATGRDLIVMFNGDYHGILDEVIARGSKKLKSFPAATGIPKDHVQNTLILDYGTQESLEIIRERMDEIAAVLVEPVQSRMPEFQPKEFLLELRAMTENQPTCLIFDEVITGLRIGLGGAQDHFGIKADLASYGKIVGGGMPIGIVAGKAEYMSGLDGGYWQYGDDSRPEAGMTYFAGTFVRHPLALAASKAILLHLRDGGQRMYDRLNDLADYLAAELNRVFERLDAPLYLANFGSLFKIQFKQDLVYSEVFFAGLRRRGMHIWDNRPCLLTLAHNKTHVDQLVNAVRDTTIECQRFGFMPGEGIKAETATMPLEENMPPQVGAKIGKDTAGNPAWFVPDSRNPGQFVQVGLN